MTSLTLNILDTRRSGIDLTYLSDAEQHSPWYWVPKLANTSWVPPPLFTAALELRKSLYESFRTGQPAEVTSLLQRYVVILQRFWAVVPHGMDKDDDDTPIVANIIAGVVREKATMAFNMALSHAKDAATTQWRLSTRSVQLFESATTLMDELLTSPDLPYPPERYELTPEYIRAVALSFYAASLERKFLLLHCNGGDGSNLSAELAPQLHKISYLNNCVLDVLAFINTETLPNKELWVSFATVKMNVYEGIALLSMSLQPNTSKGDSRRRKALHCFESALKELVRVMPGERRPTEDEINEFVRFVTDFKTMPVYGSGPVAPRANWIEQEAKVAEESPTLPLIAELVVCDEDYYHQLGLDELRAKDKSATSTPRSSPELNLDEMTFSFTARLHLRPRVSLKLKDAVHYLPAHILGCDGTAVAATPDNKFISFTSSGISKSRSLELSCGGPNPSASVITHLSFQLPPATNAVVKGCKIITKKATTVVALRENKSNKNQTDSFGYEVELLCRCVGKDVIAMVFEVQLGEESGAADIQVDNICLIGVSSGTEIPRRIGRSPLLDSDIKPPGVAIVFVLDALGPIDFGVMTKQNVIQEVLCLMIRSLGLGEGDVVGVVQYDTNATPKVSAMCPLTSDGQNTVCTIINSLKGRGNHHGSIGTPLIRGVDAAMQSLHALPPNKYRAKEVVLFSDGFDCTHVTHKLNWQEFAKSKKESSALWSLYKVHTFAMGDAADKYLLEALAKATFGDYSYAPCNADGVSVARSWFIRHLSNVQEKVATNVVTTVQLEEGVTLTNDGKNSPSVLRVPDFSDEHVSDVVWRFTVPQSYVSHDFVSVGTVNVTYTCALTGTLCSTTTDITVRHTNVVVSRDLFPWCKQIYVDSVSGIGAQMIAAGSAEAYALRGGETIQPRDAVSTTKQGNSRLRLLLANLSVLLVEPDTSIVFEDGDKLCLEYGTVYIRTAQRCPVTITALGKPVVVHGGSYVMLSASQGNAEINCVIGKTVVGKTAILTMSQSVFKSVGDPSASWTMSEETFEKWRLIDDELGKYVTAFGQERYHACRILMGKCSDMAVRLLKRNLIVKKAERYMRRIIRCVALANCNSTLKQNVANATCFPHELNKILFTLMDRVDGVLMDPRARTDLGALTVLRHLGMSVLLQRSVGVAEFYTTRYQSLQLQRLADAKAKADLEHQVEQQRAASLVTASEQRRREMIVMGVVPWLDLESIGCSTPHQVESLLNAVPKTLEVQLLLDTWYEQRFEQGAHTCLTYPEAAKLLLECTQSLTPDKFNSLFELLADSAHTTIDIVERDALTRAAYSVFRELDFLRKGYIPLTTIRTYFEIANNPTSNITKNMYTDYVVRIETMLGAIKDQQMKRSSEYLASPTAQRTPSGKTAACSLDLFIFGVENFFGPMGSDEEEAKAHRFLEEVDKAIRSRLEQRENVHQYVARQRKEKERDHLLAWDLRHVFDGVGRKDLQALLHPQTRNGRVVNPIPNAILDLVATPVCILLGTLRKDQAAWETMKETLFSTTTTNDPSVVLDTVLRRLRSFPVLSIRYNMVTRIGKCMSNPDFTSSRLMGLNRLLSALCDWVRLTVRIGFLQHDWDEPIRQPYTTPESTLRNPREKYHPPSKHVPTSVLPNMNRPHSALSLNETFQASFDAPRSATTLRSTSPFKLEEDMPKPDPFASYRNRGPQRPSMSRRFTGLNLMAKLGTGPRGMPRPHSAAAPSVASRDSEENHDDDGNHNNNSNNFYPHRPETASPVLPADHEESEIFRF